jgi:chitinase
MRVISDYISQSVTVSTKTEAMLIQIEDKHYFIEYKTNLPPIPENLHKKGDIVSLVDKETFEVLKLCFDKYTTLRSTQPWLHAPSFIKGFLLSQGINPDDKNILK